MVQPRPERDAVTILTDFFTNPANNSTKLDLSGCNLKELPSELDGLIAAHPAAAARVELLNLAHNALATLPACLAQLPSLRILFLLSNLFESIPPVVSSLRALRMLSFKSNRLAGELDATASLPPGLTWLILTSNALTGLSANFAQRCRHVRKLMLANNRLERLPPLMPFMTELELLRLANNRLDSVPADVLDLPKLKWLALAGNPATTTTTERWQQQLPPAGAVRQLEHLPAELRVHMRDYDVDWAAPLGHGSSGAAYPATHRKSSQRAVVKRFRAADGSDGRAVDEVAVTLAARGARGVVQAIGWDAYSSELEKADESALTNGEEKKNGGSDSSSSTEGNGDSSSLSGGSMQEEDDDDDGGGGEEQKRDAYTEEPVLVLERVEGNARTLADGPSFATCTRSVYREAEVGALTADEMHDVAVQVEQAVRELWSRGICHGDVYAHNILVGRRLGDGTVVVSLGDLGAAWVVPEELRERAFAVEKRAVAVFCEEMAERELSRVS